MYRCIAVQSHDHCSSANERRYVLWCLCLFAILRSRVQVYNNEPSDTPGGSHGVVGFLLTLLYRECKAVYVCAIGNLVRVRRPNIICAGDCFNCSDGVLRQSNSTRKGSAVYHAVLSLITALPFSRNCLPCHYFDCRRGCLMLKFVILCAWILRLQGGNCLKTLRSGIAYLVNCCFMQ